MYAPTVYYMMYLYNGFIFYTIRKLSVEEYLAFKLPYSMSYARPRLIMSHLKALSRNSSQSLHIACPRVCNAKTLQKDSTHPPSLNAFSKFSCEHARRSLQQSFTHVQTVTQSELHFYKKS